jgi:two-component system NarL family sensor kinase
MEQVRAGREELARAHQQLLVGHEQERRRLAHELHDGAVQQLLGISYQLAQSYRGDGAGTTPTGREMRREVLGVVAQLRRVIIALRPAGLDELGLTIALEGHVARLKREEMAGPPHIELDLDNSGTALPASVTITLFRVAQEALRNALKHAQAHHIRLCLRLLADEAMLSVWDDGCGFLVPDRLSELAQADHYGLMGMAERLSWVGGQINIRSRPGTGTEVTVRVPLNGVGSQDDRDDVEGHTGYSRAVGR